LYRYVDGVSVQIIETYYNRGSAYSDPGSHEEQLKGVECCSETEIQSSADFIRGALESFSYK
jgi:hypothetical protein